MKQERLFVCHSALIPQNTSVMTIKNAATHMLVHGFWGEEKG